MKKWSVWNVAEAWKQAHCPRWKNYVWQNDTLRNGTTDREATYHAIVAANGDTEKIDAAIGNNSWTAFRCIECETRQTSGVIFDNGDGGSVTICIGCLQKAAVL